MAALPENERQSSSSSLSQQLESKPRVVDNKLIINNLGLRFKGQTGLPILNAAEARIHAKNEGFVEYTNTHLWEWTLTVGTHFVWKKNENPDEWVELNRYIIYLYLIIT